MARTITTLIVSMMLTGIMLYGAIFFIGGISISNNIPFNGTIRNQYNAILPNQSVGKGSDLYGLQSINKQASAINQSVSANPLLAAIQTTLNGLGLLGQFIGSLGSIYSLFINIAATPLSLGLGINLGFAETIIQILIVIILALTVISAYFIYGV